MLLDGSRDLAHPTHMNPRRAKNPRGGFTLVEMMVGLTLLGVFMTGILTSLRLSSLIAESNLYDTTAITVAQGYLEQIKNLPYEDVLLVAQAPKTYSLATLGPSYSSSLSSMITKDELTADPDKQPNNRSIAIDSRGSGGTILNMSMKLWVTITDKNTGASPLNALEIRIRYQYKLPDVLGGKWMENQVQAVRARV